MRKINLPLGQTISHNLSQCLCFVNKYYRQYLNLFFNTKTSSESRKSIICIMSSIFKFLCFQLQVQPSYLAIAIHNSQFSFSFAFDAPTLWNDLLDEVRACLIIWSFCRKLKTYLFNKAYPPSFKFPGLSHGTAPGPSLHCFSFAYWT